MKREFDSVYAISDLAAFEPEPVIICPSCYGERDRVVPVLTMDWNNLTKYRLPDGERVTGPDGGAIKACLVCDWSEVSNAKA